jgi:transcriptional regulator with XRE-family HTH domain
MAVRNWPDLENLAFETKRRRISLGLRQVDLVRRGGPSHTTIREIENAAGGSYSLDTFSKLDKALALRPGSARRALDGFPFEPLEESRPGRRIDTRGLTDEQVQAIRNMADAMRGTGRRENSA